MIKRMGRHSSCLSKSAIFNIYHCISQRKHIPCGSFVCRTISRWSQYRCPRVHLHRESHDSVQLNSVPCKRTATIDGTGPDLLLLAGRQAHSSGQRHVTRNNATKKIRTESETVTMQRR